MNCPPSKTHWCRHGGGSVVRMGRTYNHVRELGTPWISGMMELLGTDIGEGSSVMSGNYTLETSVAMKLLGCHNRKGPAVNVTHLGTFFETPNNNSRRKDTLCEVLSLISTETAVCSAHSELCSFASSAQVFTALHSRTSRYVNPYRGQLIMLIA